MKIKFPPQKSIGRIDLGGIVITDRTSTSSQAPSVQPEQAIKDFTKAIKEGVFTDSYSEQPRDD